MLKKMKKRKLLVWMLTAACAASLLTGCKAAKTGVGDTSQATAVVSSQEKSNHEPITILSSYKDMSAFVNLVREKYPEINLEVIPYSGSNYTSYVYSQLETGDMPDIYSTKVYAPGRMDLSDKLIDMSGYDFVGNYSEARLHDIADNGAIYMLPTYYDCLGITYNKTLLEENGWTLPKSFQELEALAPQVEAAGYQLALCQIQYPGYGFQYLCNILDTDFLNTIDGRFWQNDFLQGNKNISDTPEMIESMKILDEWRDIGMLNADGDAKSDRNTKDMMAEGNTLFMLGSDNKIKDSESGDEFELMPYLSEDGSNNVYILNVSRYVGLNKHLEDEENEQKLEDAVHVMEVLSTVEGMKAFNSYYENAGLFPLKDYKVDEENDYTNIQKELDAGYTAPFIYSGWENVVVPDGEAMLEYIKGERDLDSLVESIDASQHLLWDNSEAVYTTITEKIDNTNCAKLVGICFAQASNADCALISVNKWYDLAEDEELNLEGVSGEFYPVPVTDEVITSVFPTGWNGTIQNVTLTGKRIRELMESGYDRNGKGEVFPYVLAAPDNLELEDEREYTVSICGATEAVAEEGKLTDTGISGLSAAEAYFSQFETFSNDDIVWK